jgi:flagellar biosynthesis chaperone FliJ
MVSKIPQSNVNTNYQNYQPQPTTDSTGSESVKEAGATSGPKKTGGPKGHSSADGVDGSSSHEQTYGTQMTTPYALGASNTGADSFSSWSSQSLEGAGMAMAVLMATHNMGAQELKDARLQTASAFGRKVAIKEKSLDKMKEKHSTERTKAWTDMAVKTCIAVASALIGAGVGSSAEGASSATVAANQATGAVVANAINGAGSGLYDALDKQIGNGRKIDDLEEEISQLSINETMADRQVEEAKDSAQANKEFVGKMRQTIENLGAEEKAQTLAMTNAR